MFANRPGFASTADHSEEGKTVVDPVPQHEGVVTMAARHDQSESAMCGQGFSQILSPIADAQSDFAWKEFVIGQCGTIVEDGDGKIESQREGRNGLRDMSRPGNPERAGWRHCFPVAPIFPSGFSCIRPRNLIIHRHTPDAFTLPPGQFIPNRCGGIYSWQDDAADPSSADQTVVPAKIVIQNEVESFRLARSQRLPRSILDFRFKAAAAHRSHDPAILEKQCLRANFLRTRSAYLGDDPQRDRFLCRYRSGERFIKRGHMDRIAGLCPMPRVLVRGETNLFFSSVIPSLSRDQTRFYFPESSAITKRHCILISQLFDCP